MKEHISYKEDPEHYKRLIDKINKDVDFAGHLFRLGYGMLKKSAGSMEFIKDGDRIVLMTSRSPVSYFNRNDSEDKGLFFRFIRNREDNFYKAVKQGLEIIDSGHEYEGKRPKPIRTPGKKRSLEEMYHIAPLRNAIYLTKERSIDMGTLASDHFKGRIFNAFHHNDNGSKIANVAFPKFDLEDRPQNYILYNRPYKDRDSGKLKKFRMVLNGKDHFLFRSNTPKEGVERIVFGESGVDLLSFHELKGKKGDLYISFGGNVYKEKLDFFQELITPVISQKKVELVSIFDNDPSGFEYDVHVFTKLINGMANGIYMENTIRQGTVSMKIHYNPDHRGQMVQDARTIGNTVGTVPSTDGLFHIVVFSDKVVLEFSLPGSMPSKPIDRRIADTLRTLLMTLSQLYLPVKTHIMKSVGKDWNDDLRNHKKGTYLELRTVEHDQIRHGDKIILKTMSGPEGSPNEGIVEEIRPTGILANFGLRYSYMVPFQAIEAHLRPVGRTAGFIKNNDHTNILNK
jgi:hypothetical protein